VEGETENKNSDLFRLRHFTSGLLMNMSKENNSCFLDLTKSKEGGYVAFGCEPILKNINTLTSGLSYYITIGDQVYLKYQNNTFLSTDSLLK
jgi:hypothetical protein